MTHDSAGASSLSFYLLGGFRVSVGAVPVSPRAWHLRRSQQIAAFLALAPRHRLPREEVIARLWPDSDSTSAANSLRVAVHWARQALAPAAIDLREAEVILNTDGRIWTDVLEFQAAAAECGHRFDPARIRRAISLYRGDLWPDETDAEWLSNRREAVRRDYLELLLSLARHEQEHGDPSSALDLLERLLTHEPYHEEGHRTLLLLLAATDRRHQALRRHLRFCQQLRVDLDAEPEPATSVVYAEIRAGRVPRLAEARGARHQPRHNLSTTTTSFVGRTRELAEIDQLLSNSRLLTLTGAGGSGKTRLALELAASVVSHFGDGVWLVELAALNESGLAVRAIATALGLHEQPDRRLRTVLQEWLADKHTLLVLDNCEHLIEECADLVHGLLRACPGLSVLATSREPLALPAEVSWWVPSLDCPAADDHATVASSEAGQLFALRATAARSDFQLNAGNAAPIAQICRRLDGIPLAIELAAARTAGLGVSEIASRLDDRFRLLIDANRAAPARHRTLEAAIEWSYRLLDNDERRLLRRLAVFAGGWTLEAAEAVWGEQQPGAKSPVYALLARLVCKSLVVMQDHDGRARYSLLETMAAFARRRLEEAGEEVAYRDRHLAWCVALSEAAAAQLESREQLVWLARLDAEHHNLRAALGWCDRRDPLQGLRLAGSLQSFWRVRAHYQEGRWWLDRFLRRCPNHSVRRLRGLLAAGFLARGQYDRVTARDHFAAALGLSRQLGEQGLEARALRELGSVLAHRGQFGRARRLIETSLSMAREHGDAAAICQSTTMLAWVALRVGDTPRGRALYEDSMATVRAIGDRWLTASTLRDLAWIEAQSGHETLALELLNEGLSAAHELGGPRMIASLWVDLGNLACRSGDLQRASDQYQTGLAQARSTRDPVGTAWCLAGLGHVAGLEGNSAGALGYLCESLAQWSGSAADPLCIAQCLSELADVALRRSQPRHAVRLLGAADAQRRAAGLHLVASERTHMQDVVAVARAQLAEDVVEAAWVAGQALSPADVAREMQPDSSARSWSAGVTQPRVGQLIETA